MANGSKLTRKQLIALENAFVSLKDRTDPTIAFSCIAIRGTGGIKLRNLYAKFYDKSPHRKWDLLDEPPPSYEFLDMDYRKRCDRKLQIRLMLIATFYVLQGKV